MTQLQSFSGVTFDVPVATEIPCPVPDWEYGVLRAYLKDFVETLEESRRIDRELEEKRAARLLEMMGEDNSP
ncbi:MAG: hypothetical protein LBR10_03345 [Prevotellaceae bacterium]|jgi:hypothetical protein|nr:hypothetical protein [Prevotellaceae bacterium]